MHLCVALKLNKSFMNLEEALLRVQEEQEELSIDEVLADFEWKAGADASALETRLNNELAALEAVWISRININFASYNRHFT